MHSETDDTPQEHTDEEYRTMADDAWGCDGEIEIDDNAVVSVSEDGGAYVAAWVWVYNKESEDDA